MANLGLFRNSFVLVLIVATLGFGLQSRASVNTAGDDLYSESLYLQKSTAEVPHAFESSARLSEVDEDEAHYLTNNTDILDTNTSVPVAMNTKKTSQTRRSAKKSSKN